MIGQLDWDQMEDAILQTETRIKVGMVWPSQGMTQFQVVADTFGKCWLLSFEELEIGGIYHIANVSTDDTGQQTTLTVKVLDEVSPMEPVEFWPERVMPRPFCYLVHAD